MMKKSAFDVEWDVDMISTSKGEDVLIGVREGSDGVQQIRCVKLIPSEVDAIFRADDEWFLEMIEQEVTSLRGAVTGGVLGFVIDASHVEGITPYKIDAVREDVELVEDIIRNIEDYRLMLTMALSIAPDGIIKGDLVPNHYLERLAN